MGLLHAKIINDRHTKLELLRGENTDRDAVTCNIRMCIRII
jgi:hypothetical protein